MTSLLNEKPNLHSKNATRGEPWLSRVELTKPTRVEPGQTQPIYGGGSSLPVFNPGSFDFCKHG